MKLAKYTSSILILSANQISTRLLANYLAHLAPSYDREGSMPIAYIKESEKDMEYSDQAHSERDSPQDRMDTKLLISTWLIAWDIR